MDKDDNGKVEGLVSYEKKKKDERSGREKEDVDKKVMDRGYSLIGRVLREYIKIKEIMLIIMGVEEIVKKGEEE
jgi:hypothetical protein